MSRLLVIKYALKAYRVVQDHGAKLAVCILCGVFALGWFLFLGFEPPDSQLREFSDYVWYFVVTISTVGYGDISPSSAIGKVVGGVIIFTGVGVFGIMLTWISILLGKVSEKIRNGMMDWNLENHFVIIGHTLGRTQHIVDQLRLDQPNTEVIVCVDETEGFMGSLDGADIVKGDLASDDIFERSNLAKARGIIVDLEKNDALTLEVLLGVMNVSDKNVAVSVGNMQRMIRSINRIDYKKAELVLWADFHLLCQAALDPGISKVVNILTDNSHGCEFYSMTLPGNDDIIGWTYGELFECFKRSANATVIGYREKNGHIVENAPNEDILGPGTDVYYICSDRITNPMSVLPFPAERTDSLL